MLLDMLGEDPINTDWREALHEIARGTQDLAAPPRGAGTFLLSVLPVDTPFRPPRLAPRVTMPGPQSAIVVGPKGRSCTSTSSAA